MQEEKARSFDVVVVGAGFAGFHAARRLARRMRGRADITVLNPTDYFLYLPLLPEVAAGILEPRRRKPYSLLPYGAIAVTYALLTVAVVRHTEMILPIALAVTKGLTVADMAHTFAIYPSLSGSITEAGRRLMRADALA